jgi:predicted phosphoadenosine phosphosulfate sulfurtransferase
MALRGNYTLGGSQASKNIALTGRNCLAMLHCVSITAAHNIVGPCNASWRKFFLVLLQALEHVVGQYRHTAALFLKFFAATSNFLRLSNIKLGGRN